MSALPAWSAIFVKREGVEGLAVGCCGLRTVVEDPHDLCGPLVAAYRAFMLRFQLTETIDSKMKPAAAASLEWADQYMSEFADDVLKTRPAARKPTMATW